MFFCLLEECRDRVGLADVRDYLAYSGVAKLTVRMSDDEGDQMSLLQDDWVCLVGW